MADFYGLILCIFHFPDTERLFGGVEFKNVVSQFSEVEKRFLRIQIEPASLLTSLRPSYMSL